MSAIIDGQLVRADLTKNAMGGTELMALRMIKHIPADLLKEVNIIHSRVEDPSWISDQKPNILVLHDLPGDPATEFLRDSIQRSKFQKIVCVSDWQMQAFNVMLGLTYSESAVIRNCVEVSNAARITWNPFVKRKLRFIYHTTPHRGLQLLVPVFERLLKEHTNIELHVYSSFSVYGWEQRDEPFKPIFEKIKNTSGMFYHGAVSNEEIRKVLPTMDVFAYPSIWPETSCLAAIEAMVDGLHVVCPNYAALPETTGGFAHNYQWQENNSDHAMSFYKTMSDLITMMNTLYTLKVAENHIFGQTEYARYRYSVESVMPLWTDLIQKLI